MVHDLESWAEINFFFQKGILSWMLQGPHLLRQFSLEPWIYLQIFFIYIHIFFYEVKISIKQKQFKIKPKLVLSSCHNFLLESSYELKFYITRHTLIPREILLYDNAKLGRPSIWNYRWTLHTNPYRLPNFYEIRDLTIVFVKPLWTEHN